MKSLNRLTDLTPDCSVSGKIMIDGQNILNTTEDITKIRKRWAFWRKGHIHYR